MSLAYALPFFCDAMLYFGALGCLGLLRFCAAGLVWVPVMLLAACWLSGRLTGRGRPYLRWLPMAAIVPCMIVAGNTAGRLVSLPMLVYLPLYVYNNRRAPDYDYAADRFRHSLIVFGLALLVALLIQAERWKDGLPWLFMYFTLSMALLRLLRHDDRVARTFRFRAINLGGVALVCAAGFGLSQPQIVAALRAGWQWFLDNVVLNVLALVMYVLQLVLYLVARLMAWLGFTGMGAGELPQLAAPMAGDQPTVARAAEDLRAFPPVVRFLLQAAGIAALAALTFVILRAVSRRVARSDASSGEEQREALDDAAPEGPGRIRLRRAPEDGVRQQYRRALLLLRARGGRVAPTMNTLQIHEENAAAVDADALAELREIYLPVRYGGRGASREDVRRAKDAYERLRKS